MTTKTWNPIQVRVLREMAAALRRRAATAERMHYADTVRFANREADALEWALEQLGQTRKEGK